MDLDDDAAARLSNPYLGSPERPAIWGVTLGRVGLAAAGVLAVVSAAEVAADDDGGVHRGQRASAVLVASDQIVVGDSTDVQQDVDELCMPAAYLWPAPCDGLEVSPAVAP